MPFQAEHLQQQHEAAQHGNQLVLGHCPACKLHFFAVRRCHVQLHQVATAFVSGQDSLPAATLSEHVAVM
jgi:hypothetical protein